jgi:hypothetical protein
MYRVISILAGTKFPMGMRGAEPADRQLIWVEGNVEEEAVNDDTSKLELEKQASRSSKKRNRWTK